MLIGGLRFDAPMPAWHRFGVGAVALAFLMRIGGIVVDWSQVQPVLEEYRTALAGVPAGSRLYILVRSSGSISRDRTPPLEHVGILAAARQGVLSGRTFSGHAMSRSLRPEYMDFYQLS